MLDSTEIAELLIKDVKKDWWECDRYAIKEGGKLIEFTKDEARENTFAEIKEHRRNDYYKKLANSSDALRW